MKTETTVVRRVRPIVLDQNSSADLLRNIDFQDLVFRGQGRTMRANAFIENNNKVKVRIKELCFDHTKRAQSLNFPNTLAINEILQPGEKKLVRLSIRVPESTPEGGYRSKLSLGNKSETVRFEVANHFKVEAFPSSFVAQGVKANQTYLFRFELTNKGNMNYTIPRLKHSLIMDAQADCKARSWSLMNDAKNGMQAFEDGVAKRTHEKLAHWVSISIEESGEVVRAGDSKEIHLSLKLPKDVDPLSSYSGEIAITDCQIIKYRLLA